MPIAVGLYLAVAVPYTLFVLLYASRSQWYATPLGRSLLLSKTVLALLSWNAVFSLAFGGYPGQGLVRVLIVGGAIIAGWSQLILLIAEQSKQPRADDLPRRRATDRPARRNHD